MLLLRVAQCRNFFDLYQMRKELRSKQFHPFKTQWAKFPTSMKCCISTEIDGVTPVWLRTWLCMSVHSAMIALDVQLRTSICFKKKQWSLSGLTQPIHSPGSKNRINCPQLRLLFVQRKSKEEEERIFFSLWHTDGMSHYSRQEMMVRRAGQFCSLLEPVINTCT